MLISIQISGDADVIVIPHNRKLEDIKAEIVKEAVQTAVDRGALQDTVQVMELDVIPLQYVNNGAMRVVAKAVRSLCVSSVSF